MAVAEGVEPGPKEEIVHIFWMNELFHPWTRNRVPAQQAITKIVDGAEAVVRGEWEWRKRT